jgi:hypothetical protein
MSCDTNINMYCRGGMARGSSVGIAIRYGLDSLGIKTRWEKDFTHLSRPALGPPSLLYNLYRVPLWDKVGRTWR